MMWVVARLMQVALTFAEQGGRKSSIDLRQFRRWGDTLPNDT
jgi:hypothetical protein